MKQINILRHPNPLRHNIVKVLVWLLLRFLVKCIDHMKDKKQKELRNVF